MIEQVQGKTYLSCWKNLWSISRKELCAVELFQEVQQREQGDLWNRQIK